MNISQMIRSVMGELHLSDAKSLELKAGQVVRGVVLQMLSEQDALVNIGGVPVRARLEASLSQGQATLLQVQPETASGQVILKPLASSGVQIAERSLPELLKGFDLTDTSLNRKAVQELHQGQVPLSKEAIKAYTEVLARIPADAEEGQWREAAILALKRGLPVTTESVGALHRLLFGRPLNQGLQDMRGMLLQAMSAEGGEAGLSPASHGLLERLRQALEALPGLPRPLAAAAGAGTAADGAVLSGRSGEAAAASAPAPGAAAGPEVPLAGGAARQPLGEAGREAASQALPPQAPAAEPEHAPWVARLLKALGVEHEQQLVRPLGAGGLESPPAYSGGSSGGENTSAADTLKGMLLSLSAAEDVPSAIREGARQLVLQITGQQLLLTADQSSMFTHMTLVLPLLNQEGGQTAAIHVQSRKGSRGELDAANCHLVFDLNMKTLGSTLVDVQVTDKIVGLRVHNDFPVLGELLEEHREQIKAGLEEIGYQLLSLKALPYPELSLKGVQNPDQGSTPGDVPASPLGAAGRYYTKPYKGMDVRI